MSYFLMVSETTPAGKYYRVPVNVGEGRKIVSPYDVVGLLAPFLKKEMQEHFITISLNGAGNVLAVRVVTVGLLNHSLVHPREVFRDLILDAAASVILVHNHPSGGLEPSQQDQSVTNQLKEAGVLIGISVLDHIIIAGQQHTSMRERGLC